jgi:hypothetical protein
VKADAVAVAAAGVGVVFCTVVLVTGPLWARPVWGIWWTWDIRLTSTLGGGDSINPRMLHVWLLNWAAFQCFGLLVFWSRYRLEILQRQVEDAHSGWPRDGEEEQVRELL